MTTTPGFVPGNLAMMLWIGKTAVRSRGGEVVALDGRARQVRGEVGLKLLVSFAADGTRSESDHFAHILHGARGINLDVRRFAAGDCCGCWRARGWQRRRGLGSRGRLGKTSQTLERQRREHQHQQRGTAAASLFADLRFPRAILG